MINTLKEHTIVCGFGRNGRQAVVRLKRHQQSYVVIEQHEGVIEENEHEVLFLKGNALTDEVLEAAGIKRAKNLICAYLKMRIICLSFCLQDNSSQTL